MCTWCFVSGELHVEGWVRLRKWGQAVLLQFPSWNDSESRNIMSKHTAVPMKSVRAVTIVSPQSNSNKAGAQPEVTGGLVAHPLYDHPAWFCEQFLCGNVCEQPKAPHNFRELRRQCLSAIPEPRSPPPPSPHIKMHFGIPKPTDQFLYRLFQLKPWFQQT